MDSGILTRSRKQATEYGTRKQAVTETVAAFVLPKKETEKGRQTMFENYAELYVQATEIRRAGGYPHIVFGNSKIGDRETLCINLPAGVTCPADAPCRNEGCYAMAGFNEMDSTQKSQWGNLLAYKANPDLFFVCIDEFITYRETSLHVQIRPEFFRFHSAGDIPNYGYLERIIWLARKHPEIPFLCFTKRAAWVNKWLKENGGTEMLPANLRLTLSYWRDFRPANTFDLAVSHVNFPGEDNGIPETAFHCPGDCRGCRYCWQMENGTAVAFDAHSGAEKKTRKKSRKGDKVA